jgi:hypothetical protein
MSDSDTHPTDIRPYAGDVVSHTSPGDDYVGTIPGPRNAAPASPLGDIPTGWQTITRQVVIPGRGWVYAHVLLDDTCTLDIETAEELLYSAAEFWSSLGGVARINGNERMAARIAKRLAARR